MSSLDKSVWSYKRVKEEDLCNENFEIILNIFDMNKFELNLNLFQSEL